MNISCSFCNIAFSKKKSHIRKNNFCCRKHFHSWMAKNLKGENSYAYGRKRPDLIERNKSLENRKKVSKSLIGHHVSEETRKKISEKAKTRIPSKKVLQILRTNWIGRKHSEETKKKMSEWQRGEKSPKWLGGISFEKYPQEFNKELKEYIRERDNYICKLCGKNEEVELKFRNRKLAIHHIDYNKRNCSEYNLITTCSTCNPMVNFSREYWTNLFKIIVKNIYANKV